MTKLLLVSIVGLVGCRSVGARPDGERARVEAVLRAYESAYNAHDAAALAHVHATDGGYYVPSGEPIVGREALERFWSRSAGSGLALTLERFESSGDVAWAVGRWSTSNGTASTGVGRFVLALRRNPAGTFEIVVDLNNERR